MNKIKKAMFAILPLAIYVCITLYKALLYYVPELSTWATFNIDVWLILFPVANTMLQAAIVAGLTIVAVLKFDYSLKRLAWSLLILFVLFVIYNIPSFDMGIFFFSYESSIGSLFFTTLLYGVVMAVSWCVAYVKKRD